MIINALHGKELVEPDNSCDVGRTGLLGMPPSIEAKQAAGSGVYAVKALMSGRSSELPEMAKTNLFR